MGDKCRTGIPGITGLSKVVNQDAWGIATADRRYGRLSQSDMKPRDQSQPQFRQDQPSDKTFNDVPSGSWLRGGGNRGKK
jgi:hypothetical protein